VLGWDAASFRDEPREPEGVLMKINMSRATMPAQDITRARKFYEEKLGLTPGEVTPDGGVVYGAGSSSFSVFPSRGKASGDHTQLGLEVSDISAAVNELKGKGVVFEEYDLPNFKTEGGIATVADSKAAWFRDTEGNLIGLLQG
jgi:catechol 2,3-dioxygenase-like lactoylglutathione lyase family enzyme